MKPTLTASLALLVAGALHAQTANPLTGAVTQQFNTARANLEESAELMPEDKYEFRLTPPQRPFGEWVGHTVMMNYLYCSQVRGEATPEAGKHAHDLKAKADLTRALKESFGYCADSLQAMDDQKALAPAAPQKAAPVGGMVSLVTMLNAHYGNIVGYLRSSNLTPPSTARAEKQQKAKKK